MAGWGLLCPFAPCVALAEPPEALTEKLSGVPIVEESGLLILNGQKVSLWGIDTLAPDQKCWQGETSWDCGAQATIALRHFVEERMVECEIVQKPENAPFVARCYRYKGPHKIDVAGHLVARGWAIDKGEVSAGAYAAAEETAQVEKRGIWDSRFQTPQDWREGVQRFVGEGTPTAESPE